MTGSGMLDQTASAKKICEECDVRLETRLIYYSCQDCGDYWLCRDCHLSGKSQHDKTHTFSEITNEPRRGSTRLGASLELQQTAGESRTATLCKAMVYQVAVEGEVQNLPQELTVLLRFTNLSDETFPADTCLKGVNESVQNIEVVLGALPPKQSNPYKIIISKKNAHRYRDKFLFEFELLSKSKPDRKFSGLSLYIDEKFKADIQVRDGKKKDGNKVCGGVQWFDMFFKCRHSPTNCVTTPKPNSAAVNTDQLHNEIIHSQKHH